MTDDRTTRKAWSMVAAVTVHAAALASWPTLPVPALSDPTRLLELEAGEPEWIFMDEATPPAGEGEGRGLARARAGSGAVPSDPRGLTPEGAEPDPRGLSDALRDRLVRSTSFVPTLAETTGSTGLAATPVVTEGEGIEVNGGSMAGLSTSEYESLEELSALDLERLAALNPAVALEALSNWVLVRNPDQVRDFILRNPAIAMDRAAATVRHAVSVAIWVSAAGNVEWAEIVSSSGRPEWDDLALELFSDVVAFRPARLEGIPMPMSAIFTVDFPW